MGNCYDNSYVESWFSSLKKEKIFRRNCRDEAELRASVFGCIERWYNRKRKRHYLYIFKADPIILSSDTSSLNRAFIRSSEIPQDLKTVLQTETRL